MNYEKLLAGMVDECIDAITEAVRYAIADEEDIAITGVSMNDGYIELSYSETEEAAVIIIHDNDVGKNSPNLEKWLEKKLQYSVDWCRIDDEMEEERDAENELHRYLNYMRL